MDFIREEFGRRVLQVDIDGTGEKPFRICVSADTFGSARIAAISSSSICNTRGRELVAKSDGCIGFVVPLSGRYIAGHNGRDCTLVPGQIMALSNGLKGSVRCPAGGLFLTIITPQENLREALNGKILKFGQQLNYSGEGLALLHAYLRYRIGSHSSPTESDRAIIGRQLIELLALGLEGNSDTAHKVSAGSLTEARSAAIQAEIDQHFSEPWFGIETCASRLRLSVRYIQAICQRGGTSFVAEVRHRRLAMAMRILMDPASQNMRVTDIALDCGYSDISHFNRQFRAAFGDSPSGVRNSRVSG